jgi:CheY-like chemotaxis protein
MSAKAAVDRPASVILVAEDDPNDVVLLKRGFARSGIGARLFFVTNGQETITYLQGQAPFDNRSEYPYPSMLLLDLNMPGINGMEVLEWLGSRPEHAMLVVVVFSSCMAPADCRQASMLGAHSCITKPLDPAALIPILCGLSGPSGPERLPGSSGELPSPTAQ